ncbi:MAG: type II toxin-antitoxin system VapC family toxin [Candidatus Omnitrophota bacterium]
MTTYVIDASVAVKWIINETKRMEAIRFLNPEISRIAPDFIAYECLAAIQKKVTRNEIGEEAGWRCYSTLIKEIPLELIDSSSLTHRAFQLANIIGHAIYDCFYLALAEDRDAMVVTADRKFYERVKASDYAHLIAWVEKAPK